MKGEKMMRKLSTGLMVGSKRIFSVVNTCFVVIVEKSETCKEGGQARAKGGGQTEGNGNEVNG
jgi:hypothetical protein